MKYDFDVALSFAGKDRNYVEAVATHLYSLDIRVFLQFPVKFIQVYICKKRGNVRT